MTLTTPPPPGLLYWPDQWTWVTRTLTTIYTEQLSQAATLASIQVTLGKAMTQSDDLKAAVSANTAATHAVTAALNELKLAADSQIIDTQKLLDLLSQGPQPDPVCRSGCRRREGEHGRTRSSGVVSR